jgi:hypothetical protein
MAERNKKRERVVSFRAQRPSHYNRAHVPNLCYINEKPRIDIAWSRGGRASISLNTGKQNPFTGGHSETTMHIAASYTQA